MRKAETVMPEYRHGDILQAEVDALVNTVNCVGVMGRGVALQFRNAFPDNFRAYKQACDRGEVRLGRMFVFDTGRFDPRFVVNFPTKQHWRDKSRVADIEAGLIDLVSWVEHTGIASIAMRPLIDAALMRLPAVQAIVYEPSQAPAAGEIARPMAVPRMTAGLATLVGLVRTYLHGQMDPAISLLEVHKLMYFMQEAGEDLRLHFVKGHYGPYAENLRHLLARADGHYLSGFRDGGEQPDKEIVLQSRAVEKADAFLRAHAETHARFERVARLVDGFETPFGLELLATVHWVMLREQAGDPAAAHEHVSRWSRRKAEFTRGQVTVAFEALRAEGWLSSLPVEA
jgi:O-acetyl-ADP-ribose deacetylase (regulator of RNase III)